MTFLPDKPKAVWVAALRSGECQQTKRRLRRDVEGGEAFCCLGVMCEVAGAEWGKDVAFGAIMPPLAYLDTFEMSEDFADTLASLNDTGYSFERIADRIFQSTYPTND